MKDIGRYWSISQAFILILLGWVLPCWALSFAPAVNYGVGTLPRSAAVGDFNHDGIPDLAVANFSTNNISILLGSGDGTFYAATPATVAAGNTPYSIAVGDFDGDGELDLAVANYESSGHVNILMGDGDGTFATAVSYAVGNYPTGVAVGDFDGNGWPDLAVASEGDDKVYILLNQGDGTFPTSPGSYATQHYPFFVAVGDFDGDGKSDLAVVNSSTHSVSVLLGKGDGTFQAASNYNVGSGPNGVVTGDFNGDGKLDLAIADPAGGVYIFLNQGSGVFPTSPSGNYPAGSYAFTLAAGDFDGDGKLDLAVTNYQGTTVSVLPGNGDGTFRAPVSYSVGSQPIFVAAGDFNLDGRSDLAVVNYSDNSVSILLNTTAFELAGAFAPAVNYTTGTSPVSAAVGDFNVDGRPDLAVANYWANQVSILLNNGNGTLATKVDYNTGNQPDSVAVGDFNGDGRPDLVVTSLTFGLVSILLNNGNGTFAAMANYGTGTAPHSVAVSDFNGDGKPDLAVANQSNDTVSILLNNGSGTFAAKVDYATGDSPFSVAVGDFNGDGKPDLATANLWGNTVSILLNNGSGTFAAKVDYATGNQPGSVAVGDFNADGKLDLAVGNSSSNTASILLGIGDGTFAAKVDYATENSSGFVAVGDFNGDGKPDLAVTNYSVDTVSILLNNGNGTFAAKVDYAAGTSPGFVAVSDFNGDGKPDLAATNYAINTVSILPNEPFIINEGEAYITSPAVTLHYYPTADHKYIRTSTGLANPTTGAFWSAWKALPVLPSHTLNLGTAQGYRNVFVQVKTAAGEISPVSQASVFLDAAAPKAVVKINGGTASVLNTGGSTTVRLHMALFDRSVNGTQMRWKKYTTFVDPADESLWTPFDPRQDVVLDGTGTKKIYVQFMDGTGKKSAVYAPSITVSNTGPAWTPSAITPGATLLLDSGAAYSLDTGVVCTYDLTVVPTSVKVRYCFINSLGVTGWTAWETPSYSGGGPYTCTRNLTLAGGNGLRQVYLQIKDISTTPNPITDPFPASIILDTSAPSANVQINNGAASVKKAGTTTTVTLTIVANDAGSGIDTMAINSTGLTPAPGDYVPIATPVSYNLNTSTIGVKYVYVWFKDNAGRVSARKSDSINVVP